MSQWSMYAKESGVSLTMDFSRYGNLRYKGYEKGNNKTEREYVVDDEVILEPKPVYYFTHSADMDEKQKMETADKILDDFFLTSLRVQISVSILRISGKHSVHILKDMTFIRKMNTV